MMERISLKTIADFWIRTLILFSTILVLIDYAGKANQTIFSIFILSFLLALIVQGTLNFIEYLKVRKHER